MPPLKPSSLRHCWAIGEFIRPRIVAPAVLDQYLGGLHSRRLRPYLSSAPNLPPELEQAIAPVNLMRRFRIPAPNF